MRNSQLGSRNQAPSPKPDPDVRRVTSDEVVSQLRSLAQGWQPAFIGKLNIPQVLYAFQEGNLLVFSSDERLSALEFLPAMRSGGTPPRDMQAYGIMIYETSGSAYLIFVDTDRRILVKDQIASFHSSEKEDWSRFMSKVDDALSMAGSEEAKSNYKSALIDGVLGRKELI